MHIYTFSEARQKLSEVLKLAESDGEVMIRRQNGSRFIIKPYEQEFSPLDGDGISLDITKKDIVEAVRKIRD